jgi:transcriptional regulator with XRE-family HTH domain
MLKKTNGHGRGALRLYRSYNFKDKDPVIDRIRTIIRDEGLSYKDIHIISGVSASTPKNWLEGETKRPQYASIVAITYALGYKTEFVKTKTIDYTKELAKAQREIEAAQKKGN